MGTEARAASVILSWGSGSGATHDRRVLLDAAVVVQVVAGVEDNRGRWDPRLATLRRQSDERGVDRLEEDLCGTVSGIARLTAQAASTFVARVRVAAAARGGKPSPR